MCESRGPPVEMIGKDRCVQNSSKFHWAPIHQAAYSNRLDILRFLLEQKNTNVNARATDGRTALHLACAYKDVSVEIIRVLVEAGCDVRIRDGVYRDTALHVASRFEDIDKVRLLIEAGSDIRAANIKNRTPLLYASKYGHSASVEALVAAGADVNAIDSKGFTSLMLAVSRNNCESTDDPKRNINKIIGTLLRHGADANIVTKDGQFALRLNIAGCGDYETFKLLFENTDEAVVRSNKKILFQEIYNNSCSISKHYDFFLTIEHLIQSNHIPEFDLMVSQVLLVFHKICNRREAELWGRYERLFSSIFKNRTLDDEINSKLFFGICAIFRSNNPRAGFKIMNLLIDYGLNVDFRLEENCLANVAVATFTEAPEFFAAALPYCISFEPWDIIAVMKSDEKDFSFMKEYEIYTDKTKCIDLKSSCRIAVRKIIRNRCKCNKTRQFLNIVESLPIPEMLKNYLRYK